MLAIGRYKEKESINAGSLPFFGYAVAKPGWDCNECAALFDDFQRTVNVLSADRIEMLRNQANFLWYHGFLDEAVDVDRWIDARPLEAALRRRAAADAGSLEPV